ncbi:hypothetical protein QYF36_006351 [Acer negundo]|nr:hypothetical protein QYF36_006351 [Acer negundo]
MVPFRRKEYWEKRGETHIKDAQFRGYVGYTAPELGRGVLNEKCDVYGFGILLLEILTGQRKIDLIRSMSETENETETKDEDRKFFARVGDNWLLDFETAGDRPSMIDVVKQLRQLYLSAP